MKFVKCETRRIEVPSEKCEFADCKKIVDGEEHYFCCERHAEEFVRKRTRAANA
jgi:YHS domain-containing protein